MPSQECTLCEKLVRDKLVIFIERILASKQHGFHRGRSCLTNLLVTLEEWTKLFDNGLPFDPLHLDFQKGFDSVTDARWIYRLHSYGTVGELCSWFEDLLSDGK